MVSDWMTSLLVLQDRDMKVRQIEEQLSLLPKEREAIRSNIARIEQEIESGKQAVKELEAKSKTLESDMEAVESQIVKYKNQQLLVKKNEEYQALAHEIETAQEKISDLEGKELELLYELDEARESQKKLEDDGKERIAVETRIIGRLGEKEENLKGQIDGAREALAGAQGNVSKPMMSVYKRVALGIQFPILVPLKGQTCSACHMKVSSAVEADVRDGEEITTCDICSRILYFAN